MEILHILWWGAVTIVISLLAIFVLMHITTRLFSFQYKNIEDADSWQSIGPKFTIAASTLAATFSAVSVCFLIYQNAQLREAENYKLYHYHREEFMKVIEQVNKKTNSVIKFSPHDLYYKVFPENRGGKLVLLPPPLSDSISKKHQMYRELSNIVAEVTWLERYLRILVSNPPMSGPGAFPGAYFPPGQYALSCRYTLGMSHPDDTPNRAFQCKAFQFEENTNFDIIEEYRDHYFKIMQDRANTIFSTEKIFSTYNAILDFTQSPLTPVYMKNAPLIIFYDFYRSEILDLLEPQKQKVAKQILTIIKKCLLEIEILSRHAQSHDIIPTINMKRLSFLIDEKKFEAVMKSEKELKSVIDYYSDWLRYLKRESENSQLIHVVTIENFEYFYVHNDSDMDMLINF